jgi:hypothetical protein
MVARLSDGTQAQRGKPLKLWFDPQHLQLFDPRTDRSLLAVARQEAAKETIRAVA